MSQSQMIQFLVWLSSLEAYYSIQVNWKSCKMYFSFKISCSSTSSFRKLQDITNLSLSEFHHFCSSRKKQPNPRALQNLKNFHSNFLLKMAKFSWTEAWVLLSVQRKKILTSSVFKVSNLSKRTWNKRSKKASDERQGNFPVSFSESHHTFHWMIFSSDILYC